MIRPPRSALGLYLFGVSVAGIPLLYISVANIPWEAVRAHLVLMLGMAAVLVISEMVPVPVPRGDDAGDEISISSTVAMAMLLIAPLGFTLIAQVGALVADEARERRRWDRMAFNIGQYILSLTGARLVYSAALGIDPFHYQATMTGLAVPAALAAGAAFFLLNNTLTAIALSLHLGVPVREQIVGDFRHQSTTSGVLLAMAPVMAVTVRTTLFALPLLLLPLLAVRRSARLAYAREHEALHDSLTGLANRTLFTNRLAKACLSADTSPVAVLLIDIDHFKEINDTLGHAAGDLLLVEVAQRLRDAVREGDLVARLGGDEFAILAAGIRRGARPDPLLSRLHEALSASLRLNQVRIDVSASVGVALAPTDAPDAEGLLQRADVAMYAAKRNRGSTQFYTARDDEHTIERLSLLGELRESVDAGEMVLEYQPKVDLATNEVIGVEGLARWRHHSLGAVPPSRFIPLAEKTGLIDLITMNLLEQGLGQLARWDSGGFDLTLAVNLSARLVNEEHLVDDVRGLLERHDIEPRRLTLEVTESMLMADVDRAISTLSTLRNLGVRVSIDDFGTGYSSLAQLKHFPVDELKIDRTFVTHMGRDRHDRAIAAMTIELAHEFGLDVVAEGVEDHPAMQRLYEMGCDAVQGFYIARPMPAEDVSRWLADRATRTAKVG